MVFQIWPKLNYEAHKEHSKLEKTKKLLLKSQLEKGGSFKNEADKDLLDGIISRMEKLEKRKQEEIESNQRLLISYLGLELSYGTEFQIFHVNSQMFLNGKILCSISDKSAYKFELSNQFGTGMIFKLLPRYKLRSEGEIVQYKDLILIYNVKLNCYANFSLDQPIEFDRKLEKSSYQIDSLYKPLDLRGIDKWSKRYEVYLSTVQEITWQFQLQGTQLKDNSTSIQGGDMILLKHTELNGYLSAEIAYHHESPECYIRQYEGKYEEEEFSVNSIWIIEMDQINNRKDLCKIMQRKGQEYTQKPYKLRHFLTGNVLTCQEGQLNNQKAFIPQIQEGDHIQSHSGNHTDLFFIPTLINNKKYIQDNVYYKLQLQSKSLQVSEQIKYKNKEAKSNFKQQHRQEDSHQHLEKTLLGFKKGEQSFYTPLIDDEFDVIQHATYLNDEVSNQNAFQIIKVDEQKKMDIMFVNSTYPILKRFVQILKNQQKSLITPDLTKKIINALTSLIFFVVKNYTNPDPLYCEGIQINSRQKIMKDMKMIEILTDILYYSFSSSSMFNIYDLTYEDTNVVKIFRLTYRLIKHTIREFRPNELYASQWIDLFMNQTMKTTLKSDIFAEATLTELIDNNKKILENKIKRETIGKFVELLMEQGEHEKYVKLLRALVVADNEAMVNNQTMLSHMIFDSENKISNHLLYKVSEKANTNQFNNYLSLNESFNDNNQESQFLISLIEENPDGEYRAQYDLEKFYEISYQKDGGVKYHYFLSFINLLADLCLNRNYVAIEPLELLFPFQLCFKLINSKNLDHSLRQAFTRLTITLWVDRSPFMILSLPNKIRVWDDLDDQQSAIVCCKLSQINQYAILKDFVKNYLIDLQNIGHQQAFDISRNLMTLSVLELTKAIVQFGFYQSSEEITELLKPLLVILNGTLDISYSSELEKFSSIMRKLKSNDSPLKSRRRKNLSGLKKNIEKLVCRYQETEDNMIIHLCKEKICDILKIIMDLRTDYWISQFLVQFKGYVEQEACESLQMSPSKKGKKSIRINSKDPGILIWISQIQSRKAINIAGNSKFNFVSLLLDLILYQQPNMVNKSFELIYFHFTKTKNLVEILSEVQILSEKSQIEAFQSLQKIKIELSELADNTENWLGITSNNSDNDCEQMARSALMKLHQISQFLVAQTGENETDSFKKMIQDEPEKEDFPNKQAGDLEQNDFSLVKQNEIPNSTNQRMIRNLQIHISILDILKFDVETFRKFEAQEQVKMRPMEVLKEQSLHQKVIRKCYIVLSQFLMNNQENQQIIQCYLEEIFLVHLVTLPSSGASLLIEQLFKNNRQLLQNQKVFHLTVKSIVSTINQMPPNQALRTMYLNSMNFMTKYKERIFKQNQTTICTEICSREYENVLELYQDSQSSARLKDIVDKFNKDLEDNLNASMSID